MRDVIKFVLAILVVLCVSSGAAAQSQKDVAAASKAFFDKLERLAAVSSNLSQMAPTVPDREYASVMRFSDRIENLNGYTTVVLTVAEIYSAMVDPRDVVVVRRFLSIGCTGLRGSADRAVEVANSILPKVTPIAAVQEITKARDLVAAIGESRLCKIVPEFKK